MVLRELDNTLTLRSEILLPTTAARSLFVASVSVKCSTQLRLIDFVKLSRVHAVRLGRHPVALREQPHVERLEWEARACLRALSP